MNYGEFKGNLQYFLDHSIQWAREGKKGLWALVSMVPEGTSREVLFVRSFNEGIAIGYPKYGRDGAFIVQEITEPSETLKMHRALSTSKFALTPKTL